MARELFAAAGLLAVVLVVGCNQPADVAKAGKADKIVSGQGDGHAHDHSGWWCDEHGVPEAECSMCSKKAYKEFQAKGDICDKHPDRAKSQCFLCNPGLKAEFAKKYKAKEGKEPPEPEGQQEKSADKK